MVTIKQGKAIASLVNSYEVAQDMARKYPDSASEWWDNADMALVVLADKFNIVLPCHNRALKTMQEKHGDALQFKINLEHEFLMHQWLK